MRWILVDKIIQMQPGTSAVGIRSFSQSEIFFMDHFPGFPIVPGVLQIEMIAQLGGKCVRAAHPEIFTILSSVRNARFYERIEPGDQAIIEVEVAVRKSYSIARGSIKVNAKRVSEAEVMFGHLLMPEALGKKNAERQPVLAGIQQEGT